MWRRKEDRGNFQLDQWLRGPVDGMASHVVPFVDDLGLVYRRWFCYRFLLLSPRQCGVARGMASNRLGCRSITLAGSCFGLFSSYAFKDHQPSLQPLFPWSTETRRCRCANVLMQKVVCKWIKKNAALLISQCNTEVWSGLSLCIYAKNNGLMRFAPHTVA